MDSAVYGKNAKKNGRCPAVALVNPRFPHNVGSAVRAASCFGIGQVWFTGDRITMALDQKRRLPREERMKGYRDVELRHHDEFFDQFGPEVVPVAVELRPNAESLPAFEHPENALYVFGPEDGSLGQNYLRHCHRFVVIPTRHCVNLAAAVYLVLYDRITKMNPNITIRDAIAENRRDLKGSFPPRQEKDDNDDLDKQLGLASV